MEYMRITFILLSKLEQYLFFKKNVLCDRKIYILLSCYSLSRVYKYGEAIKMRTKFEEKKRENNLPKMVALTGQNCLVGVMGVRK